jgi:hypothetical protein
MVEVRLRPIDRGNVQTRPHVFDQMPVGPDRGLARQDTRGVCHATAAAVVGASYSAVAMSPDTFGRPGGRSSGPRPTVARKATTQVSADCTACRRNLGSGIHCPSAHAACGMVRQWLQPYLAPSGASASIDQAAIRQAVRSNTCQSGSAPPASSSPPITSRTTPARSGAWTIACTVNSANGTCGTAASASSRAASRPGPSVGCRFRVGASASARTPARAK